MVCYFVECENIDELKSMLNFGTAGLPYVAEWVPQNNRPSLQTKWLFSLFIIQLFWANRLLYG